MLILQDITAIYPDNTQALHNACLTLNENENTALIGENGAGKTSLLLTAVGILETQSGTVEVDGITLSKKTVNDIRARVGLIFQNPDDQLFMPMLYDDLAFGCLNMGLSQIQTRERIDKTLEALSISRLKNRSSLKLSGGEKRLAAIAAVLVMNPDYLLFDEPTAYLDPKAKRALTAALLGLSHPKIIATHDLTFARAVCNRVAALKDGRIIKTGDLSLLNDTDFLSDCGL